MRSIFDCFANLDSEEKFGTIMCGDNYFQQSN